MRFIIYRNSLLATIFSMFGAATVAMAVMGMINREIDLLPGILMVAAGLGLMWLAEMISERKAKKKQAKAAQTPRAAAPVQPVQQRPAQPQPEPRYRTPEPPRQTTQVKDPEIQKKIRAYKDLLDCGILTQEEYDQYIRELTRG